MTLQEQIKADMITAMKAKESEKVTVYRNIAAAIQNKMIDHTGDQFTDGDVQKVVASLAKQLKDANKDFATGGRDDLVQQNNKEIAIMESYLPAQMSDEELNSIVAETVAAAGEVTKADMGKLMGAVMGKVQGKADGNRVKAAVMALLQ